jgi:transcriptional regulator with XRE-family HTH domain
MGIRATCGIGICRLNVRLRECRVWGYRACMPLTDRDGWTARQSLSRLLSRGVRDSEMAATLGLSLSTYSRRKDKPDFPTYAELRRIAERLGVDDTILLVDFGHIDVESLNDELRHRYDTYRNAIDVIRSLRTNGSDGQ